MRDVEIRAGAPLARAHMDRAAVRLRQGEMLMQDGHVAEALVALLDADALLGEWSMRTGETDR